MSAVHHGVVVKSLCVRSTVIADDIINGEMAGERFVRETEMISCPFL